MSPFLAVILCAASVFAGTTPFQDSSSPLDPLRIPAGTVLAFHLQTRLRPASTDPFDALPPSTVLHVKILNSIDSTVDSDGAQFRASLVSDLSWRDSVVVHADSQARVILVLLRSSKHPEGFRYELLLTELTDHGKSYPLTASLGASFYDSGGRPAPASKVGSRQPSNPALPTNSLNSRPPTSSSP